MYCDLDGTPNRKGQFEKVAGRIIPRVAQPGDYFGFDVALCDAAPPTRSSMFFTDARKPATTADIRDAARAVRSHVASAAPVLSSGQGAATTAQVRDAARQFRNSN